MSFRIMSSLVSLIIGLCALFIVTGGQQIGGDIQSTMRIVGKLCMPGNHNDEIAHKFFCCYDQAPGKQQFTNCQVKVFGNTLSTEASIDPVCRPPSRFMEYVGCLQIEFNGAGLNLADAVTKVNVCQGGVLGL